MSVPTFRHTNFEFANIDYVFEMNKTNEGVTDSMNLKINKSYRKDDSRCSEIHDDTCRCSITG